MVQPFLRRFAGAGLGTEVVSAGLSPPSVKVKSSVIVEKCQNKKAAADRPQLKVKADQLLGTGSARHKGVLLDRGNDPGVQEGIGEVSNVAHIAAVVLDSD